MAVGAEDVRAAVAAAHGLVPGEVVLRETHISWVFLAGDRAYKAKKPLVLAFVDYGTAARRRAFCEEEVRLNRRLAPDVYVGVRGLAPGADGLELVAADDPRAVEHVVEMRRYDERETLASRMALGEVTGEQLDAVAATLAAFHAAAPPAEVHGVPTLTVERRMTENFHEILAIVEQRSETDRILALERFTHAFVVAHRGIFDARARAGLVREGHGDLRAEHVLVGDDRAHDGGSGRVRVVDCVEFDRDLRTLDVADDLAFLVMELVARGTPGSAERLVRAYRAAGGDAGDDALIAFYAAYRALVRAKVALLRAAQLPTGSVGHGAASAEARDLLVVAERLAWRARLPLAIVVCGVPAAGKSHLATALGEATGLPRRNSDVTRKRLAGLAPAERAGADRYTEQFNRLTYVELGRRAREDITRHGGTIVDATFRHRADRDAFREGFRDAAPLVYVECVAPIAVLAARAAARDADPTRVSDATLDVVLRERARWDPLDEVAPDAHVAVRTDRPVARIAADVVALLDERATS